MRAGSAAENVSGPSGGRAGSERKAFEGSTERSVPGIRVHQHAPRLRSQDTAPCDTTEQQVREAGCVDDMHVVAVAPHVHDLQELLAQPAVGILDVPGKLAVHEQSDLAADVRERCSPLRRDPFAAVRAHHPLPVHEGLTGEQDLLPPKAGYSSVAADCHLCFPPQKHPVRLSVCEPDGARTTKTAQLFRRAQPQLCVRSRERHLPWTGVGRVSANYRVVPVDQAEGTSWGTSKGLNCCRTARRRLALDVGCAEARHLLPRSDWQWLADAVRDGWARPTALSFMDDTTAPIALRLRVARAFAEHEEQSAGHVPDCLTRLVNNQDAASADRLAVAMAVAQRAPEAGVELLSLLAADPLVPRKHRMQAIELLDTAGSGKALELRALQTRLPSSRSREQYRPAAEQATQQAGEQGHQRSAKAVTRRLGTEIEAIVEDLRERGSTEDLADELDDHIAEHDWAGVSSDVADICDLVLDKQVELSLQILKVLHRIRGGGAASSTSLDADLNQPVKEDFPRLTREDLVAYARREVELSWCRWRTVVEKRDWDNDRLREVDDQAEQAARDVAESVEEKTGDHLCAVCHHLVFDSWPALVDAAEEGDHAAVKSLLATTRALARELVSADRLWRASIAEEVAFDPLTLSWPHDFWVTLDEWRRAERRGA